MTYTKPWNCIRGGKYRQYPPLTHRTDKSRNLKFGMEVCFDELFGGFEWLLDILTIYPYPRGFTPSGPTHPGVKKLKKIYIGVGVKSQNI